MHNNDGDGPRRRKRKRNITYFVPPFNMCVKTKIGQKFLKIIDESFPPTNALHGKLNRHNLKLSYSCMPNQKSVIKAHNSKLLAAAAPEPDPPCSCRAWACPMPGSCTKKNVVYQCTITSQDEQGNDVKELYVGATGSYRSRYPNHLRDLRNENYRHSTKLSTYVWQLKDAGTPYTLSWRVIDRGSRYSGRGRCNLCLKEAYYILYRSENNQHGQKMCTINKRKEVLSACPHRFGSFLKNA